MRTVVTKRFRFYAAHRNQELRGKCENIHGHRYGLVVSVEAPRQGSVTIPFHLVEEVVSPVIALLDHSLLVHSQDPSLEALRASGACGKLFVMDRPTSAENLAEWLCSQFTAAGLNVVRLVLEETDSSSVEVLP